MHEPVLLNETLEYLAVRPGGIYVDGTLGNGGHTRAILVRLAGAGRVIGIDRDWEALERARTVVGDEKGVALVQGSFADVGDIVKGMGIQQIDGLLLDLGVSSEQLETAQRGFSFQHDGPLDMRMDRAQETTAADLVNSLPEAGLRRILGSLGEEKAAGRIARAIVRERSSEPIAGTARLAGIVARAAGRRGRIHPATRTFQALRMAVNDELGALERGLEEGLALLAPGGRMAVISFHSLEDRAVKTCFRAHEGRLESLQAGGSRRVGKSPAVRRLTRKPVTPTAEELARNPRARSAKLRAVERI